MPNIIKLSPAELQAKLQAKEDFFLIDVRDPEEYESGHIAGSILIPLDTIEEKTEGIRKDKPIVLYCALGRRSRAAAEALVSRGFTHIYHLDGGLEAWTGEGGETVK